MRSVLFLDIDGVLNTSRNAGRLYRRETELEFDPSACENLFRIVCDTDCAIVVSSAWRHNAMHRIAENLRAWDWDKGVRIWGSVIDKTPQIIGANRGEEIRSWLEEHFYLPLGEGRFAIVDDWDDMGELAEHLCLTDEEVGLTPERAEWIIERLRG